MRRLRFDYSFVQDLFRRASSNQRFQLLHNSSKDWGTPFEEHITYPSRTMKEKEEEFPAAKTGRKTNEFLFRSHTCFASPRLYSSLDTRVNRSFISLSLSLSRLLYFRTRILPSARRMYSKPTSGCERTNGATNDHVHLPFQSVLDLASTPTCVSCPSPPRFAPLYEDATIGNTSNIRYGSSPTDVSFFFFFFFNMFEVQVTSKPSDYYDPVIYVWGRKNRSKILHFIIIFTFISKCNVSKRRRMVKKKAV